MISLAICSVSSSCDNIYEIYYFLNIHMKNCHCSSLQNRSGFRSRSGIIMPEELTFNSIVPSDLMIYTLIAMSLHDSSLQEI